MTEEEIRKLFKEIEELKRQIDQSKRNNIEILKILRKIHDEVQ